MAKLNKHLRTWSGYTPDTHKAPTATNIARVFTPHKPMCTPGTDPTELKVKSDIPAKLRAALEDNLAMIGPTCLRENAVLLLSVYQDICL